MEEIRGLKNERRDEMKEMQDAEKLLSSKVRGEKWVEMSLPVIVGIMKEIDEIDGKRKEEGEALRAALEEVNNKYKGILGVLGGMNISIREKIMEEHHGTESVKGDEGELVFPLRTAIEIINIKKVPDKYIQLNNTAINADIKKGMAKIPGLEIGKVRGLEVRKEKVRKSWA